MPLQNLKQLLSLYPPESVRLLGLGNIDRSDDGFGILLCKLLRSVVPVFVFHEQEKSIESLVVQLVEDKSVRLILFIDAMDFGGIPGEIRLYDHNQLDQIILPISTHKPPLHILKDIIIQHEKFFYLLGIQPKSINLMEEISSEIKDVMDDIYQLFYNYFSNN